jgi:hypothetical protein
MRRWFLITITRTAILAGLIFLMWIVFIFYPSHSATKTIRQQVKSADIAINNIQNAKNDLQNLPQIDQVSIRQLHSFSNYTDEVSVAAKKLNKLSIYSAQPKKIFNIAGIKKVKDTNQQIADQSQQEALKQANTDISTAFKLADYQSKVSKSLTNVLEYDAAGDTVGFALGSDDSNQRLDLAKRGLDKTIKELKAYDGTYDDKNLASLIFLVEGMQAAGEQFSQNGDTAQWAMQVNQIQQHILTNRKVLWIDQSAAIIPKLSKDANQLSHAAQRWRALAVQYKD